MNIADGPSIIMHLHDEAVRLTAGMNVQAPPLRVLIGAIGVWIACNTKDPTDPEVLEAAMGEIRTDLSKFTQAFDAALSGLEQDAAIKAVDDADAMFERIMSWRKQCN